MKIRKCNWCGIPFQRHPKDSQKQWSRRKYCSKECANRSLAVARTVTMEDRFWKFVVKRKNGCWSWKGSTDRHGYGKMSTRKEETQIKAHRLSWEIHFGGIPTGLVVCHACDNPNCVNPNHLLLGTQTANIVDMSHKGRMHENSLKNLRPGSPGVIGAHKW